MWIVFWHQTVNYVLAVRSEDFWTAGVLDVIWRFATVLSCHIDSNELGITGINMCGHVELLHRTIQYSPGGFK